MKISNEKGNYPLREFHKEEFLEVFSLHDKYFYFTLILWFQLSFIFAKCGLYVITISLINPSYQALDLPATYKISYFTYVKV